ncbi:hypothetical protein E2C01_041336 [Portunus trituberculatus]|uniref:Reverse transcriptase domain-containing protein n=1 Tax=Portunus trituberculatus TaxID=210409 RepID=A0A5B7FQG9_PORTR|nr:hypothetical protein [Portunus trituberculatus]
MLTFMRDSVAAFVDLKSAFDIADRDITLDQLVDFGIKGNILQWEQLSPCGGGIVDKVVSVGLGKRPRVGLSHNATADHLAKLPPATTVRSSDHHPVRRQKDAERPLSVTIHHYDSVCLEKYTYRRRGLLVRRHNLVSACLRLGYRLPWQISGVELSPYT